MNKKILTISAFIILLLPFYVQARSSYIVCDTKHTLYHKDIIISAFYKFILQENGEANIIINGGVAYKSSSYVLSREIEATYQYQSDNHYHFENIRIHKNPLDNAPDDILRKHYPDFFMQEGKAITFNIFSVNAKDHIISFVSTPLFYCNGRT